MSLGNCTTCKPVEKETLFVSFSGGRSSAYMCWYLLKFWSWKYNFIFIFANTGLEHPKTLEFVNECDKRMGLNLVWIEAIISKEFGVGSRHVVVDFDTALRGDRLFREMCEVYGLPNKSYRHCNRDLKIGPINSYKRRLGLKSKHKTCIGIRADEFDRMDSKADEKGLVYPLISWQHTVKPEIIDWWSRQEYNLEIPEHHGNCQTCFKKSGRKLMTIARRNPEFFDAFRGLEDNFSSVKAPDSDRKIFRNHTTVEDIFNASLDDFVEFEDYKPEVQLRLISDGAYEIDDLDREEDCSGGCEYGT